MILKISGKEYEVSTNLGTAYDLEKKYNNKIVKILESVEESDTNKILDILFVGFKRKNKDITEDEFKELVLSDEKITYLYLIKELTVFCRLCMSINGNELDIRKDIDELFDENIMEADNEIKNIKLSDENQKN